MSANHFTVTASGVSAAAAMPDEFTINVTDSAGKIHSLTMVRRSDDPTRWVSTKPVQWPDVAKLDMPEPNWPEDFVPGGDS